MAIELKGCKENQVTIVEMILDQSPDGESWHCLGNPCDFVCEQISYWFTDCKTLPPHLPAPTEGQYIIESISHNPTTLEYGETFSTRGTIKLCMHDLPDCNGKGYWLSKFIASQKYFKNRIVNVYTGTCDQPLECFQKDTYLIDYVTRFPNADCIHCFTLKDPLSITEDAECPNKPPELQSLKIPFKLVSMSTGGDSEENPFEFIGSLLFTEGITDQELIECIVSQKLICIGEELLQVEPILTNTGWNLRLVDRGACGTDIEEHSEGDSIVFPERFERVHVADLVRYLIKECVDIESIFKVCCEGPDNNIVDWSTFEQFKCENPYAYTCDTYICKPVKISDLLKELAQVFLFSLFFDSTTGTIKMLSVKPPNCGEPDVETITQCMLTRDNFNVSRTKDSYNRVVVLHTLANCTGDPTRNNLTNFKASINTDSLNEICDQREQKGFNTLTLMSRFINECNSYVARTAADRWLALTPCDGVQLRVSVLKEVADCFSMGDYLKLEHDKIRDKDGEFDTGLWYMKGKARGQSGCVDITIERLPFQRQFAHCLSVCCGPPECCDVTAVAAGDCDDLECMGLW